MDSTEHKQIFEQCTDLKLLALCIYGEARGESELGRTAVGCVVRNRVKVQPRKSYREVILKPLQYSCFNFDDPNFKIMLDFAQKPHTLDDDFVECLKVAESILSSVIGDITGGATNYFNPKRADPDWAKAMVKTVSIGKHDFYRNKK